MLNILALHKRLGGRAVLNGVSLVARPSDIIVISGRNGAGKSTLLRLISGLIQPNRGDVEIGGHSLRRAPQQAKALLSYVPDGLEALPDLLASEFVALVRTLRPAANGEPAPLAEEWQRRLGVTAFWNQRLGALSFGQRKRVVLLAALCGAPPLLLLDEPTNGLDTEGVALIGVLLDERARAGGVTMLATNDASFARGISGAHYQLSEGRLVESEIAPGVTG